MSNLRAVRINETVFDLANFFQGDGFTRQVGLTVVDVTSTVFYNNAPQPWTLTSGAGIADNLVASGRVYFHEISGAPGHYSMRFRPNAVGFWTVVLTYVAGQQIVAQEYDVTASITQAQGGLTASFTKC